MLSDKDLENDGGRDFLIITVLWIAVFVSLVLICVCAHT